MVNNRFKYSGFVGGPRSAGLRNLHLRYERCPGRKLAAEIDGRFYHVAGSDINDHGDARAEDGRCNIRIKPEVKGKIDGGRFPVRKMALLPEYVHRRRARVGAQRRTMRIPRVTRRSRRTRVAAYPNAKHDCANLVQYSARRRQADTEIPGSSLMRLTVLPSSLPIVPIHCHIRNCTNHYDLPDVPRSTAG